VGIFPTDQCAGAQSIASNFGFINDVPAASDKDQQAWMEYLCMQQPKPTNATGVPVSIDTIDPNGNFYHIGNVNSNIYGTFALPYTPDVPGTYQIIANFEGSKAYGSSSVSTYLTVSATPISSPISTATPQSMANLYFVTAIIGIIVAIAIVGVVLALMIRKRP
jgi:hypothetical protein